MGNAALKQHVVRLLEQHTPLVVKDWWLLLDAVAHKYAVFLRA